MNITNNQKILFYRLAPLAMFGFMLYITAGSLQAGYQNDHKLTWEESIAAIILGGIFAPSTYWTWKTMRKERMVLELMEKGEHRDAWKLKEQHLESEVAEQEGKADPHDKYGVIKHRITLIVGGMMAAIWILYIVSLFLDALFVR